VDGAAHVAAGQTEMSASAGGQRAANRGGIDLQTDLLSKHLPLSEIARINSRCAGRCADYPKGTT
jgi:hypothetical protein